MKSKIRFIWALVAVLLVLLVGYFCFWQSPAIARNSQTAKPDRQIQTSKTGLSSPRKADQSPQAANNIFEASDLEALVGEVRKRLRESEAARRIVLKSSDSDSGEQNIIMAIPAPNREVLSMIEEDCAKSGLLAEFGPNSHNAFNAALKQLGDYVSFSASKSGVNVWKEVSRTPRNRILKIVLNDSAGYLSVAFTDTADEVSKFWHAETQQVLMTEIETYGRLTPAEAAVRFGHLFAIEGNETLHAPPGSPEKARE